MQKNVFSLSPLAAKEIKRLSTKQSHSSVVFRLTVKAGGCSGFYYDMSFEKVSHLENGQITPSPNDHLFESEGIQIIVDNNTLQFVKGLKLDYSEDLMGGGFRFYNPLAALVCNCGNSFNISKVESA